MIEAGEFNPSIKLCITICRALDVTLNDIFWEDEEDEENKTFAGAISALFTFVCCFVALLLAARATKKRQDRLNAEPEDE